MCTVQCRNTNEERDGKKIAWELKSGKRKCGTRGKSERKKNERKKSGYDEHEKEWEHKQQ